MHSFNNGLPIRLGPLVGIDNDFNQAVKKIDPNLPPWQRQVKVFDAAALDLGQSTLSYSSFYDPKRLHRVMGRVVENMQSTFAPGLMEQIFPAKLVNPSQGNSFEFLNSSMSLFDSVLNNPNASQALRVPLQLQRTVNGGVIPLAPEIGAEAAHFAALGSLAPYFTAANPTQPFSGLLYGSATQNLVSFPFNPGLPNQVGQITVQPYLQAEREAVFPLGFGAYPVTPNLQPVPPQ